MISDGYLPSTQTSDIRGWRWHRQEGEFVRLVGRHWRKVVAESASRLVFQCFAASPRLFFYGINVWNPDSFVRSKGALIKMQPRSKYRLSTWDVQIVAAITPNELVRSLC